MPRSRTRARPGARRAVPGSEHFESRGGVAPIALEHVVGIG
jgi:hypothetical protein